MEFYLGSVFLLFCVGLSVGLECRIALSEEHCVRLHQSFEDLFQEYKLAEGRIHINPSAFQSLRKELARIAIFIGKAIPGSTMEQTQGYADFNSDLNLNGDNVKYKEVYDEAKPSDDYSSTDVITVQNINDNSENDVDSGHSEKKCFDSVPKERCEELFRQYGILKELYSNQTTKNMLSMDAYNDLHRELVEAGLSVGDPHTKQDAYSTMTCDSSVSKEECDSLNKKYKLMKEMYSDADLKNMLDPDAYNELHREMEAAGIEVEGSMKKGSYDEMSCDSSVSKEECDRLKKKYELMKKMYNDDDLKKMLNPDAYNELHREMTEAGIETEGSMKKDDYTGMACDNSVPKEKCDSLLKKYKLMKEMYNDADLKKMLNPDAYNELHREMIEAGIAIEGSMKKDDYTGMTCDSSIPKDKCDSLLKKYKLMKEMYNDADLKKMLNPDAYNELHREMTEAGIAVEGSMKEDDYTGMTCDSSVPKEKCHSLLKKYKLMKEMYNDADLKKMLNPDAYNELHREMTEAGIETAKTMKEDAYTGMTCDSSVPKDKCDSLLKKYKLMKEMYNDADLKKMLDPDAYNELHREMREAGIETEETMKKDSYKDMACDISVPKEKCDALLKRYTLMNEMYDDPEMKKMLDPEAYNDLHREMTEAGIETKKRSKKAESHTDITCDTDVPEEKCQALIKQYKLMKEMYNDADLKKMLNPDAYNELHREMEEAGIDVKTSKEKGNSEYSDKKIHTLLPHIRQCAKDGLYQYDDFSYIFCMDGLGFVQPCPEGTKNELFEDHGYDRKRFCTVKLSPSDSLDTTES